MSLSDIAPHLPSVIHTAQAERIQNYLRHVDNKLKHCWTITLYGSAAVALYLADEHTPFEPNYTRDIDLAWMEPDEIDCSEFENESVDPPLHFQTYDVERWLIHPDWKDSIVDVTKILETSLLQVRLLHPLDLITTKLERAARQDLEDGQRVFERYSEDIDRIRKRVREAAQCYALSRRSVSQIEYSFAGIFEDKIDLSGLL